jgi:hypothetical protein
MYFIQHHPFSTQSFHPTLLTFYPILTPSGHSLLHLPRRRRHHPRPRLLRQHPFHHLPRLLRHALPLRKWAPLSCLPRRHLLRPQRRSQPILRNHRPPPLAPHPTRQTLPRTHRLSHTHSRCRQRHGPMGRGHCRPFPKRRDRSHRSESHIIHVCAAESCFRNRRCMQRVDVSAQSL